MQGTAGVSIARSASIRKEDEVATAGKTGKGGAKNKT